MSSLAIASIGTTTEKMLAASSRYATKVAADRQLRGFPKAPPTHPPSHRPPTRRVLRGIGPCGAHVRLKADQDTVWQVREGELAGGG